MAEFKGLGVWKTHGTRRTRRTPSKSSIAVHAKILIVTQMQCLQKKKFWPKIYYRPKKIFGPKIVCRPKILFCSKIFFRPKIVFGGNIFLLPNFLADHNYFFSSQIFFPTPNILDKKKFSSENIFGPKMFSGPTFFRTQIFFQK